MKVALKLRLQMYQILTKDDEVCIPILSSILLAVLGYILCVLSLREASHSVNSWALYWCYVPL